MCDRDGTQTIAEGELLNTQLPYDRLARSIGISYEECVRLFKQLKEFKGISYQRGGNIISDRQKLSAIIESLMNACNSCYLGELYRNTMYQKF